MMMYVWGLWGVRVCVVSKGVGVCVGAGADVECVCVPALRLRAVRLSSFAFID